MKNNKHKSKPEVEEFTFSIGTTGTISAIYDDRLADFLAPGETTIKRASHVEPHPDGGWLADMSPSGDNVVLGPFRLREEALNAERDWLTNRLF